MNTKQYIELMRKKINHSTEVEARGGHGYCDLSVGWSNTALLILHSNASTITSLETSLSSVVQITLGLHIQQTYPFGLFSVRMLENRVYANNP